MLKSQYLIIVFAFFMLLPILSASAYTYNNNISTKVYPPEIAYVIAHLPSGNISVDNGSIIEACSTFNITINATDDKGIVTINVSYLSHTETIDGGTNPVVVAEVPIIFGDDVHAFTVTIVVFDADGYTITYIFYVVCPDNRPPSVGVIVDNQELKPNEVYTHCGNTTIHVDVSSIDGIDYVVITITHEGAVVYSSSFDLSVGTIDTSFSRDIDLYLYPGLYTINIYVEDLSGNDETYVYYLECPQGDQPPEIVLVNTTQCQRNYVLFGGCICCCNASISVLIIDDFGIREVKTYVDGELLDDEIVDPPVPYYRYNTIVSAPSVGVHEVEIYAYDTSLNYDYFMFHLICDNTPPEVLVSLNGDRVENGSSVDITGYDEFELKVVATDNVGLGLIDIYSNFELYTEEVFDWCPPNITEYTILLNMNFSPVITAMRVPLNYTRGRFYFPTVEYQFIRIEVVDYCGNKIIFTLTLVHNYLWSIRIPPESILLTSVGAGIIVGIGALSSIGTALAYSLFMRRKIES